MQPLREFFPCDFFFNLHYFLMTRSSNLLLFAIIIVENGVLYQFFSFSNTFKYMWKCIEYLFINLLIFNGASFDFNLRFFLERKKFFFIYRCRWMLLVLFLIFFFFFNFSINIFFWYTMYSNLLFLNRECSNIATFIVSFVARVKNFILRKRNWFSYIQFSAYC